MDNLRQAADVIARCNTLMTMARNDDWDGFEKKLYERDMLINKVFSGVDVSTLDESGRVSLKTIQQLNDGIKKIVLEKQKIILDSISTATQGKKASQAYRKS